MKIEFSTKELEKIIEAHVRKILDDSIPSDTVLLVEIGTGYSRNATVNITRKDAEE